MKRIAKSRYESRAGAGDAPGARFFRAAALAVLLAGLAAGALLLTGCEREQGAEPVSEQARAEGGELQIGLSFDSFVIERWLRDREVFVSTAEELGAQVNVQNANGDVEEQIDQIRYFIQKKMDVIVVVAIDGEALVDVVKEAKSAGIKVVCYDRLIRDAGTDLYVSFDNEMVGTLMGEHLKEQLPQGGDIFAIYGSQSDNNVRMVIDGLDRALADSDIHIVYSAYCDNWLAELAFDAVSEGLKQTPRVDGIMCGNDDLASQAIRALAEQRLAGHIPVAAQDAELSACQRILEGTQTMTVYKSVEDEARSAAALAVLLGRGQALPDDMREVGRMQTISDGTYDVPCFVIDPVAVTRENLDSVIIDSGFHRREDVYLNVTGAEDAGQERLSEGDS